MQSKTGGLGGLFGAGRAKPYTGPRMNDEFGMRSPEEIQEISRRIQNLQAMLGEGPTLVSK